MNAAASDAMALTIAAIAGLQGPSHPELSVGQRRILAICVAAAAAGVRMPADREIAAGLSMSGGGGVNAAMRRLTKLGLIRVSQDRTVRQVTIVATGQETRGWQPGDRRPHTVAHLPPPAPEKPMMRVSRDPCFKCGIRADIGCEHRPAAEAYWA